METAEIEWIGLTPSEIPSRTLDLGDISRMLGAADEPTLDEVRAVVRDHLGEENLGDLESLIALGRLEFETGSPDRGPLGGSVA